jgi:nicotinamidase-related amidase
MEERLVNMGKTAVVVVDMMRDFTDLELGKTANPKSAAMVPVVKDFVDRARGKNTIIIWVMESHRAGKPDWELRHVRDHCTAGTIGAELDPLLQPQDEDYIVFKRRYSAFVGTDLDLVLRDNHVHTICIVGTKTNVCVRATAQDAFMRNYQVIVPRDCVATDRQHLHEANLEDIDRYLGKVVTAEEALALLS